MYQGRRLDQYFDGRKPISGKSMITHDGALRRKIRMPQQPAFHPTFRRAITYFRRLPHQDGHLGQACQDRRVRRDGGADLDACCRDDLQGVSTARCPSTVFRLQVRQDLHNVMKQGHPPEESGRRGDRDRRGGRRQGHGGVGERPPEVIAADPREATRAHAAQEDRGAVADPTCWSSISSRPSTSSSSTGGPAPRRGADPGLVSLRDRQAPEAAERIRREGEAVYGDREPTAADYSALAYTRAVIRRPCGSIRRSGC